MKAYIQIKENGDWLNENCYSSAEGFHRMGYDVVKFKLHQTQPEKFNIDDIFSDFDRTCDVSHGGIMAMRNLFDKFGTTSPEIHNPHEYLLKFTGRTFAEKKLKDIVSHFSDNHSGTTNPVFIKPLTEHKLFTGFVVNQFSDLIKISHLDGDVDILQSSVSHFISEYRIFIDRQDILGCKNYTGDYRVLPDFFFINRAIQEYGKVTTNTPLAYSLDFAITNAGETQLIEINDGFALGAYGLNPIYYCKMIRDRWHQIINTTKLGKSI